MSADQKSPSFPSDPRTAATRGWRRSPGLSRRGTWALAPAHSLASSPSSWWHPTITSSSWPRWPQQTTPIHKTGLSWSNLFYELALCVLGRRRGTEGLGDTAAPMGYKVEVCPLTSTYEL